MIIPASRDSRPAPQLSYCRVSAGSLLTAQVVSADAGRESPGEAAEEDRKRESGYETDKTDKYDPDPAADAAAAATAAAADAAVGELPLPSPLCLSLVSLPPPLPPVCEHECPLPVS